MLTDSLPLALAGALVVAPSGSFICEYVGELLPHWEGERRQQEYLMKGRFQYSFDSVLENLVSSKVHGMLTELWRASARRELRAHVSLSLFLFLCTQDGDVYSIDATHFGNIGRWMNHSCDVSAQRTRGGATSKERSRCDTDS